MRSVAMRPGRMTLAVMPCGATSRARGLDQPTSDRRSVLEMARLGIGAMTPEDVLVMIRPQPRSRMPGRTRSVSAITDSTMAWNWADQVWGETPAAGLGGGAPGV